MDTFDLMKAKVFHAMKAAIGPRPMVNGLRGVSRRKFIVTTERDPRARPASDLVDRNFFADAPNMLWVADVIYVPTWAGFLYLAAVLDAFSRRIIGWAMIRRHSLSSAR